jgi:exosome complex RNA-binding protein Csl4
MMSKLSLGDARAYYLSTAKNELGVVSAQSIAGMKGCCIQFVCTKHGTAPIIL